MLYRWGLVALFIVATVVILYPYPSITAKTVGSHSVGIVLSQTCVTMLKNNVSTTCPTYEDLLSLDNSNRFYSGEFFTDENGFFKRGLPNFQNSWRFYDHTSEWLVFVDPPPGMAERIKTITIHPSFDVYFDRADKIIFIEKTTKSKNVFDCIQELPNKWNGTTCIRYATVETVTQTPARIIYHDRYVDDRCKQSTINADKYNELLADTIFYLRNGCAPESTSFNHTEIVPIPLTKHDIADTKDYQHKQWIENIKKHCIYKYKACTA